MFKLIVSCLLLPLVVPSTSFADVRVRAHFTANTIVTEQGTRVSQSGGFRCNHGGGGTKRRTINNTWHQILSVSKTFSGESFSYNKSSRINFEAHPNLTQNALRDLPAEPIDPRVVWEQEVEKYKNVPAMQPKEPSQEEVDQYLEALEVWKAERERRLSQVQNGANDFRSISITGGSTALEGQGHSLNFLMTDTFSADRPNNWNSRCWRAEGNYYRHGSNTLDGYIHVQYTLPKGSQFLKLEVGKSSGILIDQFLEKIDGSLIPSVRLTNNQYIWVLGDSEEENRSVNIRFKYSAHSQNSSGSGITHTSEFAAHLIPLRAADPSLSAYRRMIEVSNQLADGNASEADLIPEIAPLIEKEREFSTALRGLTLREISAFQDVFIQYALRSTQDGETPKSPFVKAMVAVVATKISEDLSKKLLPVCVVEETTLPVLRKNVRAQRYVFMMFYLQRLIDRLSNYEPVNVFAVVNVMKDQQERGMTYRQVSENPVEQEKLKDAYEIFMNVAQVQQQPARISGGEFMELSRFAKAFVSNAQEYQPIWDALQEAMVLERNIYKSLHAVKRSYIRNPEDNLIDVSQLEADIARLSELVQMISEDVEKMTQNHLFSEVDVASFSEAMFRIFEGLNLVSGDQIEDVEVKDYYTPIFNHFFDPAELAELSNKAQKCLSGELEAE